MTTATTARPPVPSPLARAPAPRSSQTAAFEPLGGRRAAETLDQAIADPRPDAPPPRTDLDRLLRRAGIAINGSRPCDPRIHNPRLESRVRREGLVGLGDAYVDGWWDCEALDQFFAQSLRADLPSALRSHPRVIADLLRQKLLNLQNRPRARRNVEEHYNLGNDVFEATLDPYMQYTCGYWKTATDLDRAQEDKLDLVCRKLGLEPGMTLLDLGCGWGGLMRFAAERYGVRVTGITLSTEQLAYAREYTRGLDVEFRFHDYRDTQGRFDRITSIGMFEHVGPKNYRDACRVVRRCLNPGGLCLLQFFATRDSFPNRHKSEVMWINKHIFPGLVVPSLKQIGAATDNLLVLEDLHNFGADYDPTLMSWAENFRTRWPGSALPAKYGERFYRVWMYYLLSCAGAFRARKYQLWQSVWSAEGAPGGYTPVR